MEILLSQAPDRFFDQQQWLEFVAYFETQEIALARISRLPQLPFGFYREDDFDLPLSAEERTRTTDEVFKLGTKLVGDLKTALTQGRIIASGLPTLSDDRVTISAARWKTLWPNFLKEKAIGTMEEFSHVRLRRDESRKALVADLKARCIDWMQSRAAEGEDRKKILKKEAADRFGRLPERVFDGAYKTVFHKARGRPRKQR